LLKLAAISGADPYSEDLTPFDIYWMAQGVLEERWDHTASLMMMQYNCNAKKPKKMLDFHPFRKKAKEHQGVKGQITGTPLQGFRHMCKNWKDK
jgi:hypothetical protein